MRDTDARYYEALSLYKTTNLSVAEICKRTNTPVTAFRSYLQRCHRDLLLARYGMNVSPEEAAQARLRKARGQSLHTQAKYQDAIKACDDKRYIEYNISQIARIFNLNPTALNNQLRYHFPEILARRKNERLRLGIESETRRGVKEWSKRKYERAVRHLRESDDTIYYTATKFNITYAGLKEHLLYYHKDILDERFRKRSRATGQKIKGGLIGNGHKHLPEPELTKRYEDAVKLYRTTGMTLQEIAQATGTTVNGIRNYLRIWNREIIPTHRPSNCEDDERANVSTTKRYLRSAAVKYREAIKMLKAGCRSTAEIAREFSLNPDVFRAYLREHEPELASNLGMTRLANGRLVLARTAEKYSEGIAIYTMTSEPLKSIAKRLNIQYNSLNSFISRNCPEAIAKHNKIVEEIAQKQEHERIEEKNKIEQQNEAEKNRIIEALERTNNNKRNAAKLLGISKST